MEGLVNFMWAKVPRMSKFASLSYIYMSFGSKLYEKE